MQNGIAHILKRKTAQLKLNLTEGANCNSGAAAVLIGLSFPVLLLLVGASVDTGYAVAARTDLAHVTKIACDRLATSSQRGMTKLDQLALTNLTISANLDGTLLKPEFTAFDIKPDDAGKTVGIDARSAVKTHFMKLVGIEQVGVAVEEQCAKRLRIPTESPQLPCETQVPVEVESGRYRTNLADAIDAWQQHNTVNGATPPAPDEMVVTALSRDTGEIIQRDLLTNQAERGDNRVVYKGLPNSLISLQPAYGFPNVLPEACIASPVSNPPVPPTTTNPPPQPPSSQPNCDGSTGGSGNSSSASNNSNSNNAAGTSGAATGANTSSSTYSGTNANSGSYGGTFSATGTNNRNATINTNGGSSSSSNNSNASSSITASASGCQVYTKYSSTTSTGSNSSSSSNNLSSSAIGNSPNFSNVGFWLP